MAIRVPAAPIPKWVAAEALNSFGGGPRLERWRRRHKAIGASRQKDRGSTGTIIQWGAQRPGSQRHPGAAPAGLGWAFHARIPEVQRRVHRGRVGLRRAAECAAAIEDQRPNYCMQPTRAPALPADESI
jgi:hypothetical protein